MSDAIGHLKQFTSQAVLGLHGQRIPSVCVQKRFIWKLQLDFI